MKPSLMCRHVLGGLRGWMRVCLFGLMGQGMANEAPAIYRCGNAYTNQPSAGQSCHRLSNLAERVIVIEGTRVQGQSKGPSRPMADASADRVKVDDADQRQRDRQAHAVLQAELQGALRQHAELLREWRNGEPERRADEFRQPQKYQDRVAQLRAALQRTEADVAGLQRELSRLTGGKP